jgi:Ca2+-binding RTX toxin-like protein
MSCAGGAAKTGLPAVSGTTFWMAAKAGRPRRRRTAQGGDLVDYTGRKYFGVRVDLLLTGAQDTGDGLDQFVDIEDIVGSQHADKLSGDDRANRLDGYKGADVLLGRGGDDVLIAGQIVNEGGGFADYTPKDYHAGPFPTNGTMRTAYVLGGFTLQPNAIVTDSDKVPHFSVYSRASTGDADYYRFSVAAAGVIGYFDLDTTYRGSFSEGFDPVLTLLDRNGAKVALNDSVDQLDPGSRYAGDSYLVHTFKTPGTYYIQLSGRWGGDDFHSYLPDDYHYWLHFSLTGAAVSAVEGSRLEGGDGDDILHGSSGADTLLGGAGNDYAQGANGDDPYRRGGPHRGRRGGRRAVRRSRRRHRLRRRRGRCAGGGHGP